MYDVVDFLELAVEKMTRHIRELLAYNGMRATPENMEQVTRSIPRAGTDLTAPGLRDRSSCIDYLLRPLDDKKQSWLDPKLEKLASYFIDYIPSLTPGNRRMLEAAVIGVLRGMKRRAA